MKKLFLTLIVTMLTCIGMWAQGTVTENPVQLKQGESKSVSWSSVPNGNFIPKVNFSKGQDVVTVNATGGQWGSSVKIDVVGMEIGEAEFTVSLHATVWNGSANVPVDEASATSEKIVVNVVDNGIKVEMNSENPLELDKDAGAVFIPYSITNAPSNYGTRIEFNEAVVNAEMATWDGKASGTYVKLTPNAVGTTTLSLVLYNNGYGLDHIVFAKKDLTVNVIDKECATTLEAIADQTVALGYTTKVPVTFAPSTAILSVTSSNSNIGASYTNGVITLSADASVAENEESTITITPKAGSAAEAVTFKATTVAPVDIESVSFENASITLAKGTKENVVATVIPSNAANTDVNYIVADNTVVSYSNGVLTALKRGTTTITATSEMDDTKTAVLTVNVTDQLPVILGKPKNRYVVGTVYSADLTVGDDLVLGEDYTATYKSSNPAVLSVDNSGTLTALKAGTTKITVVYEPTAAGVAKGYTTWNNFLDITVDKGEFDFSVSAGKNYLESEESTTITPTVKLGGSVANADLYTISYASDDENVEVNGEGNVTVKSTDAKGSAHITVTLKPTNTADYEAASVEVLIAYGYAATGSGAIATLASDGFVELFIPSPGAYGTVTPAQYSGYDITRTYSVGSDELLRNAKKIRITGYISNEDVQAFSNLVGGNESKVTDLDMGGAKMSEAITETLPTDENWNISFLAPGFRNSNANVLSNVQNFVMPQPADNSTVIPANFVKWFKDNGLKLQSVEITHGWTEVGDGAFSTGGNVDAAGLVLSSVKFPNTLEVIGEYAFSGHRFTTLNLPKTITELKSGAFETKKPNTLKDVYFLGEYAPIVHKDAFATITHIANDSFVHPRDFAQTDVYNYNQCVRENYYDSQNGWCAKLHYPASLLEPGKEHLRDLYVDPYRVYSCTNRYEKENNTSTLNSANKSPETADWTIDLIKGDKIVLNENAAFSSVSDFASKVQSADFCAGMTINGDNEIEPGFYDKAIGKQYVWPSQQQFLRAYGSTRNGYFYTGVEMDEEQKQRIGLYEFIFTDPDVNNESTTGWTFPGSYEQDLWWTICVPFNMSVEQIKAVFGPNTEVCRFSRVVRTLGEDGVEGKLRLEFKNSVMGEVVEDADGNPVNWGTGNEDGSLGILAHHPYMIYPSGETEALYKLDGKRYFPNYTIVDGDVTGETITAVDLAETPNEVEVNKPFDVASNASETGYIHKDSQPARYTFIGNYMNVNVPQYAYYLGLNNSVERSNPNYHQFYFNNLSTPLAFNPYTCVVYNNFGEYDNHDYFNGADPETALAKSIFGVELGDDYEATGVKNIEIVCGNNNDNKVYNLKGQLVNGNLENLPSGVYIVNGKKYIK